MAQTNTTKPVQAPANFTHKTANTNGIDIHYVIGGEGEPLMLIHGFGENWHTWNRLLPELSKYFTVIATDLPGVGESDKPDGGYDKKTLAGHLHELANQLGYEQINIAGHDIGLMVAYAYAALYASEVKKVALLDAVIPGLEPIWTELHSQAWWWGFFGWPASAAIVDGRAREFLTSFWPLVAHTPDAFTHEEKEEIIRAYTVPGAVQGSFRWFAAFPQDAKDNQELIKQKLKMPLLAMGGEFGASYMPDHCKLIAENVTPSIIKGAGHWLVQENTEQVLRDLLAFFKG